MEDFTEYHTETVTHEMAKCEELKNRIKIMTSDLGYKDLLYICESIFLFRITKKIDE